ncbi:hypothetical protein F5B19DRAFT_147366 [Rostrohypoxylon terebratum]|nr:hypothetical protein F5B19DRAFT_147366 [Rostrohypoxylon terebratum]
MLMILIHFVTSSVSSFRLVCYPMTTSLRSIRFCQSNPRFWPPPKSNSYNGGAMSKPLCLKWYRARSNVSTYPSSCRIRERRSPILPVCSFPSPAALITAI